MPRRHISRRRRAASASSLLWILVILTFMSACQLVGGVDVGQLVTLAPTTAPASTLAPIATTAPAPSPAPSPVTPTWYRLYFTDPSLTASLDNPEGGLPDELAMSFDTAQRTIDMAVYEFDLMSLAEALLRADQRGVQVRVVTDTDYLGEDAMVELINAGIPVVGDGRSAIMHDKFVVIDGVTVWTGSMNFTFNDAYRNNNNLLQITSTRLAQNYTREFEEMFLRGEFGPTSTADTPNPSLTINETLIHNYFSPDDGVAAHLLEVLRAAQSSIRFMAFSFTRTDFAEALIERAQAGVVVQGVFETRQISAGGDAAWLALTGAGLDVRQDGNRYNLHSKVFIVDDSVVVLGSYNFSNSAEDRNDENVLVIHSPEIAAAYLQDWLNVWAEAAP